MLSVGVDEQTSQHVAPNWSNWLNWLVGGDVLTGYGGRTAPDGHAPD